MTINGTANAPGLAKSSSAVMPPQATLTRCSSGSRSPPDTASGLHDSWILKMWNRMDRDRSGTIVRKELDCEEFHTAVLAAVAPATHSYNCGTGGVLYSRSEMNMQEAISFCLRKADLNQDKVLTFAEFRSFMKTLSDPCLQAQTAHLAFSLFDLDCSLSIDKKEFREVMRFFLGRTPTEVEHQDEWRRLAAHGQTDRVTRGQYLQWLRTTTNPVFRQHALPLPDGGRSSGTRSQSDASQGRPRWNQRFNATINPLHYNDFRPPGGREYFSTHQSIPELKRFFDTDPATFKANRARLETALPAEPTCSLWPKSLSTEGGTPLLLPKRHEPRGLMRDHKTGRLELWDDNWSPPIRLKSRFNPGDKPYAARTLFGELTDSFALSREGAGVLPEPLTRRRSPTRIRGGAVLGAKGPPPDRDEVLPARRTTLEVEPW